MLIWAQVILYMLHQYEEHAMPGGFKDYVNNKVFKTGSSEVPLNSKIVYWINIPVVWFLMPVCAVLSKINLLFGVWIPFTTLFNSLTHVIVAIVKREYNPGLYMSLVFIPVDIYTLWVFNNANLLSGLVVIISFVIAFAIHLAIIVYARLRLGKTSAHP